MNKNISTIEFVEIDDKAYLRDSNLEIGFDIIRDIAIFKKQMNALRGSPIFKAIGKLKSDASIIDATFGHGKDSAAFLALGLHVEAFERNDLIFKLANFHLSKSPIDGLNLYLGDCRNIKLPDIKVIYFDPMFENSRRKTLSKKQMQIFKKVTQGDNDDSDEFLMWALEQRFERIVIKRALKAKYLLDKKPICSFTGKSVRYDLYRSFNC